MGTIIPERRALILFANGKTKLEVLDALLDEFPKLTEWQALRETDSAYIIHKEKAIPDENKTND